ncbi:MAG: SDR family oxidoreductase [Myxococcales bacterium]|nr:SDR family NAD(P)-dependent oxidoreductase [Sorangiineae bacterium PRO1]MCL4751668.1 SDR family oxidoreductase [Myxococcales bacterium]
MTRVNAKRVLVTGGTRGIGEIIASKLAQKGAHVVVWGRDPARLEATLRRIERAGGSAEGQLCDVADRVAVYDAARELKQRGGSIDVLVNNAGIVSGKPFLELTDEEIERTLQVNTLAHFWTAKAFLPDMVMANQGHLVTISSAAGLVGVAGLTDYCASKFAAFGFHEALRLELRKLHSRVKTTVVCPYYVDTGMFAGVRTRFSALLPILKPEDVAQAVVRAIEKNQARVLMPRIVYSIPLFRLVPVPVMDLAADALGLNASMDSFVGRGEGKPPEPERPKPRRPRRHVVAHAR